MDIFSVGGVWTEFFGMFLLILGVILFVGRVWENITLFSDDYTEAMRTFLPNVLYASYFIFLAIIYYSGYISPYFLG